MLILNGRNSAKALFCLGTMKWVTMKNVIDSAHETVIMLAEKLHYKWLFQIQRENHKPHFSHSINVIIEELADGERFKIHAYCLYFNWCFLFPTHRLKQKGLGGQTQQRFLWYSEVIFTFILSARAVEEFSRSFHTGGKRCWGFFISVFDLLSNEKKKVQCLYLRCTSLDRPWWFCATRSINEKKRRKKRNLHARQLYRLQRICRYDVGFMKKKLYLKDFRWSRKPVRRIPAWKISHST